MRRGAALAIGVVIAAALAAHYVATALLVTSVLDPSYRLERLRATTDAIAPGATYAFG